MRRNAKLLPNRAREFRVETKHNRQDGRLIEAVPVSETGHRVLVGLREERFKVRVDGVEREFVYQAGTGFLFNRVQEVHQIFSGGMYDMMRSKVHVSRGESADSEDAREKIRRAARFIYRLRTWPLIENEGQLFADDGLRELANQLGRPKRAKPKLVASERFGKASELRTETRGRRMPMPSLVTADAGAKQLEQRRADVREILSRIDPERVSVSMLVEGVHMRLDDAWREFGPEELAKPGNPVVLASVKPTPYTIKVMREYVDPIYSGLREIKVQPLNGLAVKAVAGLMALRDKVLAASGGPSVDISQEVASIRAALSTMRLVRDLEMEVITPLSMRLECGLRGWRQLNDRQRNQIRLGVVESGLWFNESLQSKAEFLPPDTRTEVARMMEIALDHANKNDGDSRKRLLKVKTVLKNLSTFLSAT
jgi:hypothetical protein